MQSCAPFDYAPRSSNSNGNSDFSLSDLRPIQLQIPQWINVPPKTRIKLMIYVS